MNPRILLCSVLSACAVGELPSDEPVGPLPGPAAGVVHPPPVRGWSQLMPGSACEAHTDCDSEPGAGDGFCYRGVMGGSLVFPDSGYCAIDDGTGAVCATDEDCPSGATCASIEGYRMCLPMCGEGGECPAGQACLASFGGFPLAGTACLPGNANAQDGDGCGGFYDCNANSQCFDDGEHPGGYCSAYGCTLGTDAGCNGGRCIEYEDGVATGTVCVEVCTEDADCRADEGYICHDAGGPDGGYCRHPHVGDACTDSAECGDGWSCKTGSEWPGGHCTMTACPTPGSSEGCSAGSLCIGLDGSNLCVDRCATVGATVDCRDGYTCEGFGIVSGGICMPL